MKQKETLLNIRLNGDKIELSDTLIDEIGDNHVSTSVDTPMRADAFDKSEEEKLPNPWLKEYNLLKLPEIVGISVNQITTGEKRIKTITKKYHPDIESMEGASLHYVCREFAIPFLQIRTISNEAGERDKTKWDIKTAINNLNKTILAYLDKLYTLK